MSILQRFQHLSDVARCSASSSFPVLLLVFSLRPPSPPVVMVVAGGGGAKQRNEGTAQRVFIDFLVLVVCVGCQYICVRFSSPLSSPLRRARSLRVNDSLSLSLSLSKHFCDGSDWAFLFSPCESGVAPTPVRYATLEGTAVQTRAAKRAA